MISFENFRCPHCGAEIRLNEKGKSLVCEGLILPLRPKAARAIQKKRYAQERAFLKAADMQRSVRQLPILSINIVAAVSW